MNQLRANQLRALARIEAFPCVTLLYPVEGGGAPGRPDAVRLRNALRTAREELAVAGVPVVAADELLEPATALAGDPEFWRAPPGGMAIYVAPGFFRPVRVDRGVHELVCVGRRFLVRPLLAGLESSELVYVLALSRKRVRLLEVGAAGVRELDLPDLPTDFVAAVGELQFHSAVQARTSSPAALGRRPAIFHGHGDDDEEHLDADLESFFRRIVEVLEARLPDREAPLVVAAVAEHLPAFRRAARRLRLLDLAWTGNPDPVPDSELGMAARRLVERERERELDRELANWGERRGGGLTADELEPILHAAEAGQVETLYLAREAERWGCYDPDLRRVILKEHREPGDEELLDRAASKTFAHGGDVHAAPLAMMPEGRIAVATLRYALAGS